MIPPCGSLDLFSPDLPREFSTAAGGCYVCRSILTRPLTYDNVLEKARAIDRLDATGGRPPQRGLKFEDTRGRAPGLSQDPMGDGVRAGTTLVGAPDTVTEGIERLIELSEDGFGRHVPRP